MPDLSKVKSKGTPFDPAEYRRSCQKQAAEGTLRPVTAEMEASFAPIRRVMERSLTPYPEPEWKGAGTFIHIIEDEDVEDLDVRSVDTTEDLYDVSDTEASKTGKVSIPFVKHTELTKRPDTKDQSKDEGHVEFEAVSMPNVPWKVSPMPPRANTNVVASNSVALADRDDRKLLAAFQDASETVKDTINSMLQLDLGEDLRQASCAEGKRKHSDTDEVFTRKRARATAFH